MRKHHDCEFVCMISEHKGYSLCASTHGRCEMLDNDPDGDAYEEMTIEKMNQEESRHIDRENAQEINRNIMSAATGIINGCLMGLVVWMFVLWWVL